MTTHTAVRPLGFHPRLVALAAMTDEEVVTECWRVIGRVPNDQDDLRDDLYAVVGEALERFAPAVGMAALEHERYEDEERGYLSDSESELAADREGREQRRKLREILSRVRPELVEAAR